MTRATWVTAGCTTSSATPLERVTRGLQAAQSQKTKYRWNGNSANPHRKNNNEDHKIKT